ncbi:hypothetical protein R1sor_005967 [Riccia sorocarpa]|uniref:NB-ARC domain-containing protein n=1 Tax=Riccia sorocarpa TaxID=122646 RepID=A0ABD3HND5_9MARC
MAASSSRDSGSDSAVIHHGGWKRLSDSVFEVFRPSEGYTDLEIVFLHGFQSKSDTDSYYRTWMKADGSANWLDTLLAESFPRARILSVSYDSSLITTPCTGREDMYLLGESLVQSLVNLAGVGRTCPVVLVGHCLGGMVLKKIALCAESSANQERSGRSFSRPYESFLKNVKGAFFLSTPSLGANVPIRHLVNQGGPLLKNLQLLGTESARINAEFAKLLRRWKWITHGVFAANETETTKFLQYFNDIGRTDSESDSAPQYLSIVPEASARADMDGFGVIAGVDHFTICQSSDSFAHLISFLTKIKEEEKQNAVQLQQSFGLHSKILDLDHRVQSVITKLQFGNVEPLGLALVGLEGIGKSTLAKQVVITVRHQFEYVCLVELGNVERSRRSKILETLVAQNLLYSSGRRVGIDEGQQPWVHIRGKKVLLVVDDVHSEDEISQLFRMDWCGEGSRLIITSSRQDWTRQLIVHQVPLLSKQASYELLATYLDKFTLKWMPKKVISQVVDGCGGLPLVLEVIGKYLWDKKEVSIWVGALKKLKMADSLDGSAEENVIWRKLKVSFDSLGKLEKQVFLDVATFDLYPPCKTRYNWEIFRSAWGSAWDEDLIDVTLMNLQQRSFLRLTKVKDRVAMYRPGTAVQVVWIHKQMRTMAAWICGPDEESLEDRRSIWQLQNVTDLLANCNKVSRPRTEVLSISVERKTRVDVGPQLEMIRSLQWSSLGRLKVLRLLRISDTHMLGTDKLKFPPKLALLHMENCTREPQKENRWLPWSLKNLSSWPLCDKNIEELGALSVLIFKNTSNIQLPQNFCMLRCLKILQIHNDGKPMGPLPENIGLLSALKHLSLNVPLKKLPNSLLQLPSLQRWTLRGEHLQTWPIPITVDPHRHLTALTELDLMDLPALVELPDSFGGLASLEHLKIVRCSALERLPEGFGALPELRTLSIQGCNALEMLCDSFSSLSQLHRLYLRYLPKLKMLPVTIGDLPSLKEMALVVCPAIKELPWSFTNLASIRKLKTTTCDSLESLWPDSKYCRVMGLTNLHSLHVLGCPKLQGLPKSLDQLKALKHLRVHGCRNLRYSTEALLQLTSLTYLQMSNLAGTMTGMTGSDDEKESLEPLNQMWSPCILGTDPQTLPASIGLPGSLEELEAHSSKKIVGAFDSVTHLPGLKWLGSQDDQHMSTAPQAAAQQSSSSSLSVKDGTKSTGEPGSVGQLSDLQNLTLWDFEFTSSFAPQLVSVKELRLRRCRRVAHILKMMTTATGMQRLCIIDCQTFSSLPNSLGNLSLLIVLRLVDCQDLISLPETIGQLMSLRELEIKNCLKLTYLPVSMGQLNNLQTLYIENCRSILTIPDSVYHMTWLSYLRIFDYRPFISNIVRSLKEFTRLKTLGFSTWNELSCLQEFMGSFQLEAYQLPRFHVVVKCMECEDTVVPLETEDSERRTLRGIDDSCGCIHTIGFLKWVEKILSYRGTFKLAEKFLIRSELQQIELGIGYYYWKLTVVCGRVNVKEFPWKLMRYTLKW